MKHVLIMLIGLVLAGCATTQDMQSMQYRMSSENQRLEERIAALEAQKDPIRSAQANQMTELESMRSQISQLLGRVDSLERESQASESMRMSQADELAELRAKVRTLESNILQMSSQLGIRLENTLSAPRSGATAPVAAGAASAAASPSDTPDQNSSSATPSSGDAAMDLYNAALENFKQRRYDQAQAQWAQFVSLYPNHEFVANALFWQGESLFQQQEFGKAILTYQEVIEKFPKSNKVPASLLKQGVSFYKLDKKTAGDAAFDELTKRFPKSPEAERAKEIQKKG